MRAEVQAVEEEEEDPVDTYMKSLQKDIVQQEKVYA